MCQRRAYGTLWWPRRPEQDSNTPSHLALSFWLLLREVDGWRSFDRYLLHYSSGAAEHGEPDYKLVIYNQHQLISVRIPFSLKMQVRLCEAVYEDAIAHIAYDETIVELESTPVSAVHLGFQSGRGEMMLGDIALAEQAEQLLRENAGRNALLPFIKKFDVPQKIKRDDGAWRKRAFVEMKAALQHKVDQLRQDHWTHRQVTLRESTQRQSAQGESTQLELLLKDWLDIEGDQRGTPWDRSSSP